MSWLAMLAKNLVSRQHCVRLHIYGHQHSAQSGQSLATVPPNWSLREEINRNGPDFYLVETTPASLQLSQYVWENRDAGTSAEEYLRTESSFVETPAILSAAHLGLNPQKCIFPIDVDSAVTRRRLAFSLLPHPWESLILISRYYGKSHPTSSDSDSIARWRCEFEASCPTAFKILFSDREDHMRSEILRHISTSPPGTRIAAIVGMSHVDAIYEKLLLLCQ